MTTISMFSVMRNGVLIAVALVPISSRAQVMPPCVPPATVHVSWVGAYTGCVPFNDYRGCAATEPVTFIVTGVEKPIPICAAYLWDFGDKTSLSPAPSPTHTYATAGVFNFFVRVRGTVQDTGQ